MFCRTEATTTKQTHFQLKRVHSFCILFTNNTYNSLPVYKNKQMLTDV